MAHQLGVVFVEERIAVVGEVDDEGILLAVALYNLVDDVVGVEQAIGIGCYDLILASPLRTGKLSGVNLSKALGYRSL